MSETETITSQCDYPGCKETASIECGMLGCLHYVCEVHGNCSYEDTPDNIVEICWSCAGKGWGEVEKYNREMDARNRIIAENRDKPWLPFHDRE
jgi:hypothetical protein